LLSTAESASEGRFIPGQVVGGRFRIVGLKGKGGMGEVYRADDLTLGQSVALKFLSESLSRDSKLLDRLLNEVRLARQITHPNVCSVYDIGEVDGQSFVTMEYVDGEDLSTLLKRIGRLPRDKALQIAWQLCAGLAAIHSRGILHRDLKPSNVMLDGKGHVRIADFGVAGMQEGIRDGEICGTPEYMAPEQLAGKDVSEQSDLYSLGLVLYEVFTGKRVYHSAATRLSEPATPPDPAWLVAGLDPAVGETISQCLEPNPRNRPRSAQAVVSGLPGGDPLRAALAEGQTPSPEMVAAAGARGELDPRIGSALLALLVVGLVLIAVTSDRAMLFRRAPLEQPPDVLASKARDLIEAVGYKATPKDRAFGFETDSDALTYLENHDPSPMRWQRLKTARPAGMLFWYRQSAGYLEPKSLLGKVRLRDPPNNSPGMSIVVMDPLARLLEFHAVPSGLSPEADVDKAMDWSILFRASGLDPEEFAPSDPRWPLSVLHDTQLAWEGHDPVHPDAPIHIEAGAYRGRPVFFRMEVPWGGSFLERKPPQRKSKLLFNLLQAAILVACALLARRNLRLGRGDRKGARRLALYVFTVMMLEWLLEANHVRDMVVERAVVVRGLGTGVMKAMLFCWIPYVALEPWLRSQWPERITSWSRLLAGRFGDPLVGRDLLIGTCAATVLQSVLRLYILVPEWLGHAPPRPESIWTMTLIDTKHCLGEFFRFQEDSIFFGFGLLFLLLLLRFLVRSEWLAMGLAVALVSWVWFPEVSQVYPYFGFLITAARMTGFVLVLSRFGVLAAITAMFFDAILNTYPVTFDLSAWYAESAVFVFIVLIGLGAYGLFAALGRFTARYTVYR
jgi:serine/threonine-protein kinase